MFPLSLTIPPSRSHHSFAKKKSPQTQKLLLLHLILHSCQRMSILSLFISSCLYRPLSHLLYSLHRGESTHLPSRGATPLPSISLYSPLGGDWYLRPPPFSLHCLLHPVFTPSLSTFISPPVTSPLSSLPLKPQVFNLHFFFFLFYLDIRQIVYALAYELLIKMHYVGKQSSQLVRIDVIVYTGAQVEQTHRHYSVRGE